MMQRVGIFVMLWLTAAMLGCRAETEKNEARGEEASFGISGTSQRIVVRRSRSHETLPEYTRVLELWNENEKKAVYEMFPDTGGTVKIDVRRDGNAIYLSDRISTYKVDLASFQIVEEQKAQGSLLGIIDSAGGNKWKFTEASEKGS
jgi:hypothetical protein